MTRKPIHSAIGLDPTRTGMLRRKFMSEFYVRFTNLQRKITDLVVIQDSFGKRVKPFAMLYNEAWQGMDSVRQMELFKQWLQTQINTELLPSDAEDVWLRAYINQAYRKGVDRAATDSRKFTASRGGATGKASFLESAFNRPPSVARVRMLVARSYTELAGITDSMSQQINRTLVDGFIRGESPEVIARLLNDRVDKIGLSRSLTLARTEVIRAHAEGQLDGFEEMGLDKVGVMVEWSTGGRPCPMCADMNGVVIKLSEARGMIPRHGNCKCCFLPANVGEPTDEQIRTRKGILAAVKASVKSGGDDGWAGSRVRIRAR